MSRIGIFLICTTVIVVSIFFLVRQRESDANVRRLTESMSLAEREREQIRRDIRRRDAIIMAQPSRSTRAVSSESNTKIEHGEDHPYVHDEPMDQPDESTAANQAPLEKVLENVMEQFDTEQVDSQWTNDATSAIEATVQPFLTRESRIQLIDCRTSMCRVEFSHQDIDAYRDFMLQVLRSDICRDCFAAHTGETPAGQPVMSLFLARQGHILPRVPNTDG